MTRLTIKWSIAMLLILASVPVAAGDESTNPFHGVNVGMHGGYGSAQRVGVNSWWFEGLDIERGWDQFTQSGGQIGVHMGYNYVLPSGLLFGARVSFAISDIHGMDIDSVRDGAEEFTSDGRNRQESISMAQARIGYATDTWSVHAIGGYAITTSRNEGSFTAITPAAIQPSGARIYGAWDGVEKQTGWVAGVGAGFMLSDRVSVSLDYTFLLFDKLTAGLPGSAGILGSGSVPTYLTAVIESDMHLMTVGISYRL